MARSSSALLLPMETAAYSRFAFIFGPTLPQRMKWFLLVDPRVAGFLDDTPEQLGAATLLNYCLEYEPDYRERVSSLSKSIQERPRDTLQWLRGPHTAHFYTPRIIKSSSTYIGKGQMNWKISQVDGSFAKPHAWVLSFLNSLSSTIILCVKSSLVIDRWLRYRKKT